MARYILEISERARPRHDPGRARHAHGDGHRRPGDGARLRPGDRHRHARRGAGRPRGDRGLPRGDARDGATACAGAPHRTARLGRCPALLRRGARSAGRRGAAPEGPRAGGGSTRGPSTPSAAAARRARAARARRRARRPRRHPQREPARVAAGRPRRPGHRRGRRSASTPPARPPRSSTSSPTPASTVLIVEDEEQLDKVLAVRERLPALRHIVVIDTARRARHWPTTTMLMTFAELRGARGGSATSPTAAARVDAPRPGRAVADHRLHVGHDRAAQGRDAHPRQPARRGRHGSRTAFGGRADDEVLSYLPLCHVAERLLLGHRRARRVGYVVNFGEGGESLIADLREVQPTFFLGVPRVWEKMLAGDRDPHGRRVVAEAGATTASGCERGAALARQAHGGQARRSCDRVMLRARLAVPLPAAAPEARPGARARGVLRRGADRPAGARVLLGARRAGARGLRPDRGHGARHLHARRRRAHRHGRQGPRPVCEIRIADDGEILVRGPGVFPGYSEERRRRRARRSTPTAGCTPATSASSTPTAT